MEHIVGDWCLFRYGQEWCREMTVKVLTSLPLMKGASGIRFQCAAVTLQTHCQVVDLDF